MCKHVEFDCSYKLLHAKLIKRGSESEWDLFHAKINGNKATNGEKVSNFIKNRKCFGGEE